MKIALTLFFSVIVAAARAGDSAPGCALCATEAASLSGVTETKWLEPEARKKAWATTHRLTNQDGAAVTLDQFAGKPIAITFLYTRCDNPNKCPRAAAEFAKLQSELQRAGLDKDVRLLIVTYDPEFDSPETLSRYASEKNIRCGADAMLLRPDPAHKQALFDELNVAVNFNASRVNIHGLQLLLIDKDGRFVRSHHTLIWDNEKVLRDLTRLSAER